jgi:hypothetical protein
MKQMPGEDQAQWARRMLKRGDVFAGPAKESIERIAKLTPGQLDGTEPVTE